MHTLALAFLLPENSAELAAGLHIHAVWQIIRKCVLLLYGLYSDTATVIYFCIVPIDIAGLYSVPQPCTFTGCVFHSKDLEDTVLRVGLTWRWSLLAQRLPEGEGTSA